ncbi:hypothetical protein PVAND_017659 [Polypedilum vanderplanki]|uniref:ATP-dependent DNA helicase n=1 Tax=Polypedilum vanderplanki TaxID=319348 RepID=A0A9J6B918_POLVA|nr:hypothetical protein PVAND_017659 [Polypedilum vanderplanki]
MPKRKKPTLTGRIEKQRLNLQRQIRRQNSEYLQAENEKNSVSKRARRSDEKYLQNESARDLETLRARRSDGEYSQQGLNIDNESRRARRSNPEYSQRELSNDNETRRARRSDGEYSLRELNSDNESRRARRSDGEYSLQELNIDNESRRARRSNPEYTQRELSSDNESRRARRSNPEYTQRELSSDNETRRARRSNPEYTQRELSQDKETRRANRNKPVPWNIAIENYNLNVKDGPFHRCFSCDKLLFSKQVSKTTKQQLLTNGCSEEYLQKLIISELYNLNEYTFCLTCLGYIKKKNFPRFNINNSNLRFPDIPQEFTDLKLTSMEERCVSARIPFMTLVALGCDRQIGIKSGVVNVPIDVRKTIDSIPAKPEDTGIIELSLKRKKCYRSVYMKERVRPGVIWKAANMLCQTELYQQEGIRLNYDYEFNDINVPPQSLNDVNIDVPDSTNNDLQSTETVPTSTEEDHYIQEETMLDSNEGIQFAPGEGQIPIPMFLDPYCEELSFPTIYFGKARHSQPKGIRLSYEDIVKSELQRYDRRACRADHLLFMHKKSQIKQLMGQMNIVFRKSAQTHNITASQAANKQYIDQSICKDNAYKFMSAITGSPAYWEQQKKKVLGMVRQYGIFTVFITLTAAETHWPELLVILKKTVDKEDISEEEASDLSFQEKARLIRTDPATCALYFDYRFKEVQKTWHNVTGGPFGTYRIIHYFYRIEFQHRGSPHVHMVIWLEGAPIFVPHDLISEQQVVEFIDFISTTNTDDLEVSDLIKYQKHKCSHTCKKTARGKIECRFGAPFRPMDRTRILYPNDDELDGNTQKKIQNINKHLKELLNDKSEEIGTFDDLLTKLNCTLDEYLQAARVKLKHPTIFVKREPKNTRINVYNKKILLCMRSNMDIQFVLDPYSCIGYIVDYVNKSSRGLSKLLRECVEDAKKGNYSLKERLKSLAHILYNSSEICAQEAAWCRLRLAMCRCSDAVEFINTNHSSVSIVPYRANHINIRAKLLTGFLLQMRTRILKSNKDVEKLAAENPDSTEIFKKGPIDHYACRPDELNDICLAEFVANYSFKLKAGSSIEEDENQDPDAEIEPIQNDDSDQTKSKTFQLKDGSGTITERKSPKVIRYCRFNIEQDEENFLREMCLLFLPWRDEKLEIEEADCATLYFQNRDTISANYSKFNKTDLNINEILNEIEEDRRRAIEQDESNQPNHEENLEEDDTFLNVYEFDDNIVQPDFSVEIGEISRHEIVNKYVVPDMLNDEDFLNLLNSLNVEQRDYIMHIINVFKENREIPIYHFITGGAGVGKSVLIRAIFQAIKRIFRIFPGTVNNNEILLLAFTGMAAHNIGGITAHSAFNLVTTQGNAETILSPDVANTMTANLKDLKLIIIDEISLLSSELLNQISSRLKQIFHTTEEFGGVSVIAVGDFNQLPPVGGTMAFKPRRSRIGDLTTILTDNPQWALFKYFKLHRVMRQRDDLRFAEALNRLSIGATTPDDNRLFESRCFTEATLPEAAKRCVRLMKDNAPADAFNLKRIRELAQTSSMRIVHRAEDRFSGHITERKKNQAQRELANLKRKDSQNLVLDLELVIGVKYMIATNIDVTDGLFNGATGVLKFIEIINNRPQALYLEMDDKTIGRSAIGKRKDIMVKNKIPLNWTPIFKIKKTFNVLKNGSVQVTREQYPLNPAECITVHKSQGQSMPKVAVDLYASERKMDRSMLYVAFSRATSLEGLFIIGQFVPPEKVENDNPVRLEYQRMERDCLLIPKFKFLQNVNNNTIQIISQNIQSLQKHISCIKEDLTFLNSHLILLQETWAQDSKDYNIPGFTELSRNAFNGPQSLAQGTIIFVKDLFANRIVPSRANVFERQNQHIEVTSCIVDGSILILNIYKNPSAGLELCKEAVQTYQDLIRNFNTVFLFGDLNEDLSKESPLETWLNLFGLKLISERKATTNYGTTIDGIFCKSLARYSTFIYETYYSYHKPLLLRIMN